MYGERAPGGLIKRTACSSRSIGGGIPAGTPNTSCRNFRLALEKAPAGSRLHAAADEGVPIRAIAEVIGQHLDVPVVSVPAGEASEHFGFLAGFLAADNPVSSTLTRELLGWQPAHPGLIEDLDKGHYFHNRSA
jgi:nucleoside-diphosphate-sugar epimerase